MITNIKQFKSPDGRLIVIDLALNIFLHKNDPNALPQFDQSILLRGEWIQKVHQVIIENQEADPECIIGIDMSHINACFESRAFENFATDIKKKENVFFFGIASGSTFHKRIVNDMTSETHEPFVDKKNGWIFLEPPTFLQNTENKWIETAAQVTINNEIASIIKKLIDNRPNYELLCSSSVYADKYIDIKALFMNPADLRIILFYLAKRIVCEKKEYDALVATSKNGSVLAELLGQLLGRESIHCISVGPQFSVSAQTLNNSFKPGKNYIYVGDFVCLGTEVKLLQVLIADRGATLVGGVSVASYIQLDNEDLKKQKSPLCLISSLINLLDENIDFNIRIQKQ